MDEFNVKEKNNNMKKKGGTLNKKNKEQSTLALATAAAPELAPTKNAIAD